LDSAVASDDVIGISDMSADYISCFKDR